MAAKSAPIDLNFRIRLQPKQKKLQEQFDVIGPSSPTWLGYGGALGGGKSDAIRRIMLIRRLQYPNTNGVIIRRVYDDVKKNHIDPYFSAYPQLMEEPFTYRSSDHEIIFPNGSKIMFMYAETAAEVERKFTGIEFFDIMIDQAEQFSEGELRTIKTRNRWPGVPDGTCKMGLFFNPGGAGTEFLRRVFWLKQYNKNERASDFLFLQAYGWDNWYWFNGLGIPEQEFAWMADMCKHDGGIGPAYRCCRFHLFINHTQYGRELNALPESLRAGHLLGSFDKFAGQYFAGVWDESKCVLSPTQVENIVKPWWVHWGAQDWGFAHNAAAGWAAVGKLSPSQFHMAFPQAATPQMPVDIVVIKRELVVDQTGEGDFAQMIADLTPEHERTVLKDMFLSPDAWAKRGSQNTIADTIESTFRQNGLPVPESADDDRIGGWRFMWNCLKQTCSMLSPEPFWQPGFPMLLVSAECPEIVAAIPLLKRDTKHPGRLEDVEKTDQKADDVGDMVRYLLKSKLSPRLTAPRDVRVRELMAEKDREGASNTVKAMAMRQFIAKERTSSRVGARRWRG